ncbi:MAG TPA: DUF2510 domain-containing protein [Galbitalea sp.]
MTLALQLTRAPAGWYADPAGSDYLRWWDGALWTTQLQARPLAPSAGYKIHRLRKPGA